MDWWNEQILETLKITFTPTRHSAGRGISDREKCLWGGWAIKSKTHNYYFSGDGGYGQHFKVIGEKLGPFDFAFMECGQYNPNWHKIHMYPEESVQAGIDTFSKVMMAVHWAGFALAQHDWTEPVDKFIAYCIEHKVRYITPKIGEVFSIEEWTETNNWWQNL